MWGGLQMWRGVTDVPKSKAGQGGFVQGAGSSRSGVSRSIGLRINLNTVSEASLIAENYGGGWKWKYNSSVAYIREILYSKAQSGAEAVFFWDSQWQEFSTFFSTTCLQVAGALIKQSH